MSMMVISTPNGITASKRLNKLADFLDKKGRNLEYGFDIGYDGMYEMQIAFKNNPKHYVVLRERAGNIIDLFGYKSAQDPKESIRLGYKFNVPNPMLTSDIEKRLRVLASK